MIALKKNKFIVFALVCLLSLSQWLISPHVHNPVQEEQQSREECSFHQHRNDVDLVSVDSVFVTVPVIPNVFNYVLISYRVSYGPIISRYQSRAPPSLLTLTV